ncbi:MAG: DUF1343 domain-containing protein [Candidatus Sumerlaeia bacterium]|nr:DUF1343 domain-containing protein [Candidatus Sumerlaeia bacterium]
MQKLFVSLSLFFAVMVLAAGCSQKSPRMYNLEEPNVKLGVEVLLSNDKYLDVLRGKRVGLITNPTGVDSRLNSTVDLLNDHPEIEIRKLFAPEHGVRGDIYAGVRVDEQIDKRTGLPVHSIYGNTRRPPQEYLDDLDIMVYDIQDVGSRSYTFIYSMAYSMEECAKRGIPFMVLDRPNPCGPVVSGNILDPEFYSGFVGLYPIPYQYGMTPGEIAMMFNKEFNSDEVELYVVPMEGYRRDMMYWDTNLPWVMTSPHIPSERHAVYYNLTGIIGELRHISIGVGYTTPFETIAAPWMDGHAMTEALREKELPGLLVRPISYRPFGIRFEGEVVHGVHFTISNYHKVQPVEAQIHIMEVIQRLYPEHEVFSDENAGPWLFDQVLGTRRIRDRILAGWTADDIIAEYMPDVEAFMPTREKYLIYR